MSGFSDQQAPDSGGANAGQLGGIRPCGKAPDAPAKFLFDSKENNTPLDIKKGAPRAEVFVVALIAYIKELKRNKSGATRIDVKKGKKIENESQDFCYQFPLDSERSLFEGSSLTANIDGENVDGEIVSISNKIIVILLKIDFGPHIEEAVLKIDNTAILSALANQLKLPTINLNHKMAIDVIDNKNVGMKTRKVSRKIIKKYNLNERQKDAVGMGLANSVTFLWGPPGTGKTATLTALLSMLIDDEKRALITSNTNQAVDQVLLTFCKRLGENHPDLIDGKIIRFGKIHHSELEKGYGEFVSIDGILKRKTETLRIEQRLLEKQINDVDLSIQSGRIVLKKFERVNALHSESSRVVNERATTKTILDKALKTIDKDKKREVEAFEKHQRWQQAGAIRRVFMRSEEDSNNELEKFRRIRKQTENTIETAPSKLDALTRRIDPLKKEIGELQTELSNINLKSIKKEVAVGEEKISKLKCKLDENRKKQEGIKESTIKEAKLVGATVTKSFMQPKQLGSFDVVVIDEASMVLLPALYFVSGLSKEKVVVSGDFRQLAPIVTTKNSELLETIGVDIFHASGVVKSLSEGEKLNRTVMLDTQYRMVDPICKLISDRMYGGRLRTDTSVEFQPSASVSNLLEQPLCIVDTSALSPVASKPSRGSKYNLIHALLVKNIIQYFSEKGFIDSHERLGVCTPYSAQAKLLKSVIEETTNNGLVEAGTVHRYQGDQKTAMIFEVSDSFGSEYVSPFLQSDLPNENGTQLFNVGVSRARQHLIFIANLSYLDSKLPDKSFARELLYKTYSEGVVIDAKEILSLSPIENDLKMHGYNIDLHDNSKSKGLLGSEDFHTVCMAEIESAKSSVVIFSGFITKRRASTYFDIFKKKIASGVKIRCVTRPPQNNGTIPIADTVKALNELEKIGCVVDTRWDMHQKVVIIDEKIVWNGSLNPLSHREGTGEIMCRVEGKGAIKQLAELLAIAPSSNRNSVGLIANRENQKCPDCNSRSFYRTYKNKHFLECESGCGWIEPLGNTRKYDPKKSSISMNVELQKCPKCGSGMVKRNGKYGQFLGCNKYPNCSGTLRL